MPLIRWCSLWLGLNLASAIAAPDYLSQIKPLLTEHCTGCHGTDQQKGDLRLDTAAAALAGGEFGPAYVPGNPSDSLLIQVLEDSHDEISRMPYRRPALSPDIVQVFREWIAAGAPAPADETPGGRTHWAFQAPTPPPLPPVRDTAWVRNPIDAFILARLESRQLHPSPEADRITLLRRVALDLTGLPPSPEEVDAFLADSRPDAYERAVDSLLRSPHYGERWGRWWLDVARYADSHGYSIDAPRSIWPWRDWVIRAFNDDLPFDRMTVEQLAGDLLPDASLDQRVATGFHRNTQINQEGGIDPEQFRIESVVDRVNTTATAYLGLTVACAQCHDHKFDPISHREYFQLFAFFNNQDEPGLPLPNPAQQAALADHRRHVSELEAALAALAEHEAEDVATRRQALERQLAALRRKAPPVTTTMVLTERAEPRESYIHIQGDFTRRGPDVQPGTPAILHPLRPNPTHDGSARPPNRLDLARWIVDPANPLTARVTMNRVWQQYFGRGLVETENDFGTQGSPPSHPDLLDWLAIEFQSRDWSLKAMHRLIVSSATYRQSSRARPDLADIDASNRLLARQKRLRLDAEIIRDVALVASGKLHPAIGGPGVFPPQPDGVMNLGQSRRPWTPSEGPDRYRRGLYTYFWRATPHPALTVFDAPDSFSACTRRPRSNTPLQALTLLNDHAFVELAQALAERLRHLPAEHDDQRLTHAFRLCLARPPSPTELDRLRDLLALESRDHGPSAAWDTVARVLLNLDETITRE
ncbi:MAG: PSD1 domain-containing protein [Verrucomicrobiae bacterium]|nr:PSD1 domain-containing protein [Verrucomicrobiae bacterium]